MYVTARRCQSFWGDVGLSSHANSAHRVVLNKLKRWQKFLLCEELIAFKGLLKFVQMTKLGFKMSGKKQIFSYEGESPPTYPHF